MPKIVINEIDLTTPGGAAESTDIVYIPGFVNIDQDSLYENKSTDSSKFVRGKYIGLEVGKPQLFTSVSQFISMCGKSAPTFAESQQYSDVKFDETATAGLDDTALMFKAGDPDPSYIMAKELLAAGIGVLYERVNSNDKVAETKYVLVSAEDEAVKDFIGQPAGPDSALFYKSGDRYVAYCQPLGTAPVYPANGGTASKPDYNVWAKTEKNLADVTAEEWNGVTNSVKNCKTYYVLDVDAGAYKSLTEIVGEEYSAEHAKNYPVVVTFAQAATVVEDWNTNYTSYCKKNGNIFIAYSSADLSYKTYEKDNIYRKFEVDSISIKNMYASLEGVFDTSNLAGIVDKGNYSVKYLTSGGYPVFEYDGGKIVTKMLGMAETRGDCVALIDHVDNQMRSIDPNNDGSVYKVLQGTKDSFANGDFGAMFTPWATYNRVTTDTAIVDGKEKKVGEAFRAPGSFAYLAALADSIKTNANWLAIAGAARGGVRNLAANGVTTNIPNGVADAMQPRTDAIAINAMTNIKPYGLTIWGNRTLKPIEDNLVATSFLNIRNLVSDIKKTCYRAARKATFEQDTDILWINFKSEIAKLLDRMKSGYGISGYKIVRDNDHEKAAENATLCAKIIIYPTYAVEDFYITVVLQDDEVSVN